MESIQDSQHNYLILPNHPWLIDPQIIFSVLGSKIPISPVMTETYYNIPVLKYIFKAIGAISVPDLSANWKPEDIEKVYENIVKWLQEWKNIVLYPAGQIYSQWLEKIIGKKTTFEISSRLPKNTKIIQVRTRGVWGSIRSKAYTGKWPIFFKCIQNACMYLLLNGFFFLPRRQVTLHIQDVTNTLIKEGEIFTQDMQVFNKTLEDFYNIPWEEAAIYIPHFFYYNDVKNKKLPEHIEWWLNSIDPTNSLSIEEIPQNIQEAISKKIQQIKKIDTSIHHSQKLINDLFFDSLDSAELKNAISQMYPKASNPPITSLKTVLDCYTMALGKSQEEEMLKECKWSDISWEESLYKILKKYIWKNSTDTVRLIDLITKNLKQAPSSTLLYDSIFWTQSKEDILLKSCVIREYIKNISGEYIAIMLPSLSSTNILITSIYLCWKIPVMLNWTIGKTAFDHCVNFAKTEKILTSRAFYEKIDTSIFENHKEKFIFLEDLLKDIPLLTKIKALIQTKLLFPKNTSNPHAVILFTSGSEWLPKAVALTHKNIIEVLLGSMYHIPVTNKSILLAFLPPFHSFWFTVNTILPLLTWVRSVNYPNPNDAKNLVKLIQHTKADFITSTPTFLRFILQNAQKNEVETVKYAVVWAEKCQKNIFESFKTLCPNGVILEGYGITECSPVISINPLEKQKESSVGKPIFWLEIKILSLNDLSEVETGKEWMIYVFWPSVFHGYLDTSIEPPFEKINGKNYYKTWDLWYLDTEGYLYITGRLKRFIKIGWEMISLPFIEGILNEKYGTNIAVEAQEKDGNAKIVVFTTPSTQMHIEEINAYLREKWASNLIKISQVIEIAALPVLGTWKIDYKELKKSIQLP